MAWTGAGHPFGLASAGLMSGGISFSRVRQVFGVIRRLLDRKAGDVLGRAAYLYHPQYSSIRGIGITPTSAEGLIRPCKAGKVMSGWMAS
jgi:hypothetical protein